MVPENRFVWQLNSDRMDCGTAYVFTNISLSFSRNVDNYVHGYTAEVITM